MEYRGKETQKWRYHQYRHNCHKRWLSWRHQQDVLRRRTIYPAKRLVELLMNV